MATTRTPAPDIVTMVSLHAALDGIVEIEALFTQIHVPPSRITAARRVQNLANEMRVLLVGLLRSEPR
jgi:hypothetical protein